MYVHSVTAALGAGRTLTLQMGKINSDKTLKRVLSPAVPVSLLPKLASTCWVQVPFLPRPPSFIHL